MACYSRTRLTGSVVRAIARVGCTETVSLKFSRDERGGSGVKDPGLKTNHLLDGSAVGFWLADELGVLECNLLEGGAANPPRGEVTGFDEARKQDAHLWRHPRARGQRRMGGSGGAGVTSWIEDAGGGAEVKFRATQGRRPNGGDGLRTGQGRWGAIDGRSGPWQEIVAGWGHV